MAIIRVPKPPSSAFNPGRRASDLLKQQVEHLEWAVLPAGRRRGRTPRPPRTEAEAAARTEQLMRQLPHADQLPLPPRRAVKRARRAPRPTKAR
ncbi:MAG: hypothetical protein AB7O67_19415 [Vicinamibacterales bacterium]